MWAVFSQYVFENQLKTKHVESSSIACMDEGSIPSDSTLIIPITLKF